MTDEPTPQEMAAFRSREYRVRKRRGAMVVSVEVERHELQALERLGLLPAGERHPGAVGYAVARFMATSDAIAKIGESLYPMPGG